MSVTEIVELKLLDNKELQAAYEQGDFASVPNEKTRFFRTFFPWQIARFIWINIRMVIMIVKSHH